MTCGSALAAIDPVARRVQRPEIAARAPLPLRKSLWRPASTLWYPAWSVSAVTDDCGGRQPVGRRSGHPLKPGHLSQL